MYKVKSIPLYNCVYLLNVIKEVWLALYHAGVADDSVIWCTLICMS